MNKQASILLIIISLFSSAALAAQLELAANGPAKKAKAKKSNKKQVTKKQAAKKAGSQKSSSSKIAKAAPKKGKKKSDRPVGDLRSTDVDVLKANKDYHKKNEDWTYALKWVDRIIDVSSDSEDIKDARLEKADVNYNLKDFEKAADAYKEYLKLYPGSDEADYAKYRQIASNYYRMPAPDRDQSLTRDLLLQAKDYLDIHPAEKAKDEQAVWIDKVKEVQKEALKNLLEAEIDVFESNLKALNYEGAERRLGYIKKKYLPEMPYVKSNVEDLEQSLEQSRKKKRYVQAYKKERQPILKGWKSKSFKHQF